MISKINLVYQQFKLMIQLCNMHIKFKIQNFINCSKQKFSMSNFYKELSYFSTQDPPVQSTIKRLSEKINDISKSQQSNIKISQFASLQNRVQSIETKIQQNLKILDKTIKLHKQTLIEASQKLSEIQSRNQLCKKVRTNEIKQLQNKMSLWFNIQKKNRVNIEQKILSVFEQKFQGISLQLSKEIEKRKEYLNILDQKLAQTLPLLKNQIVEQLQSCSLTMQQLQKKLDNTTQDFKQSLKTNEESHNQKMSKIMQLLTETVCQVKKQISDERGERQVKKNQIMELFQGAYKKLIL